LGVAATLAANIAHGPGHCPTGAAAAWHSVALVGSYELLMMVTTVPGVPANGTSAARHDVDPLKDQAAEMFADQLAAD
jgi:hypothetical protein